MVEQSALPVTALKHLLHFEVRGPNARQPALNIQKTLHPISSLSPRSLVAYYPFDGDANDHSGHDNHGTLVGGVTFVAGRVGQAARFDGTTGAISVPHNVSLRLSTFTLAAWIFPTAIEGEIGLWGKETATHIGSMSIRMLSHLLAFTIGHITTYVVLCSH